MKLLAHKFSILTTAFFLSHAAAFSAEESRPPDTKNRVAQDVPYDEPANPRQMVDVYAPPNAKNLPVVFWIHGGGWQAGDKTSVQLKPQTFVDAGFVFVSVSYRFVTQVKMGDIVRDVAKGLRWTHDNVAKYGGDPERVFVMGHSAGAQLAALICTDDRFLKTEGLTFAMLRGCVPVDGDTYDVPLEIATTTARRKAAGQPEPKFGHPEKFGDPEHQRDLSAVNHVAKKKGIPPFLLLHVAVHPDTTAQAERLRDVLVGVGISAKTFAANDTNHSKLNADLGEPGDPATKALFDFVADALKK